MLVVAGCGILLAQEGAKPAPEKRNNVTGAFEGWFKNPDGSFSLLLGYFNRNEKQEFDIPDRAGKPDRAGRSGSRAADAFSVPGGSGECSQ